MNIDAHALDAVAFRAWPAAERMVMGRWTLRATSGLTRRANSVWACGGGRRSDIARVEAFYSERGLPPRFQLTSVSAPQELDAELHARGYRIETPVSVRAREIGDGLPAVDCDVHTTVLPTPDARWLSVVTSGRFGAKRATFEGVLRRIGSRAGFALGVVEDAPAAAALGVHDDIWVGLYAVVTLSSFRRRGAARALIAAIAQWAAARGATHAYHQTERDNAAALALSDRYGMVEAYGYHYRTQDRGWADGSTARRPC